MKSKRIDNKILMETARRVADHLKKRGEITSDEEEKLIQELLGLAQVKVPTDTPIQDLLLTVDIVRDAMIARDKDRAFEAITVLLLQWMQAFNYSEVAFQAFGFLEGTKEAILAEDFDEALTLLFCVLSKIREIREPQEKVSNLVPLPTGVNPHSLNSNPRRPIKKTRDKEEAFMDMTLYYRESISNGGLVFAEPDRAEYIARVHDAISKSKTWGEFRKRMPKAEYTKVMGWKFDEDGIRRPKSTDSFSAETVPGVYDGDYPDWLQQEMYGILPLEICEKYGTREQTMLNGDYLHIEKKNEKAICRDLEKLGYKLVKREDLTFW